MRTNNRINGIINMCSYSDIIIDLGCDHAYIAINLIKENKCKKCIAVDINDIPLNNAKKNVSDNSLNEKIICLKSDGFDFLKNINSSTSSVIAGMGGSNIANILNKSMDKINKMDYILIQPTAYVRDIRKFLFNRNIHIEKEDVIFSEGVYYEYILIFPKSQGNLSKEYQKNLLNFDYDIPICIFKNIDGRYNNYIDYRIKKYEKILHDMEYSNFKNKEKYHIIYNKISILKGYIK